MEKWRTVEIHLENCYKLAQIFHLYGSCAGRVTVCEWDSELLWQIAWGKTGGLPGLAQQRGGGGGAGDGGVTIRDWEQGKS